MVNKTDKTSGLPEADVPVEVGGTGLSVMSDFHGHITKAVVEFEAL